MNIFLKYIEDNRISSEIELRRLFWKIAKKIHPDITSLDTNNEKFITLKKDYDEAKVLLNVKAFKKSGINQHYGKEECINLFCDLMASNFPIDKSITNKKYEERINLINRMLNSLIPDEADLFHDFEKEMYLLKGETVISNHLYGVVKLYLYRFCDYVYLRTRNNKQYLLIGYDLVHEIFVSKKMHSSIKFVDWLVKDIMLQSDDVVGSK